MTDRELMQMALEEMEKDEDGYVPYQKVIKALRDRLAQPEPEPVANRYFREIYEVWAGSEGVPLPETCTEGYLIRLIEQMRDIAKKGLKHTTPLKREWVGLTDEERADCWSSSAVQSAINIEAKLKEKNT